MDKPGVWIPPIGPLPESAEERAHRIGRKYEGLMATQSLRQQFRVDAGALLETVPDDEKSTVEGILSEYESAITQACMTPHWRLSGVYQWW